MLSLLDGISPFHWLTLSLVLGVGVMLTSLDMLLWPAAAALLIGLLLFTAPDMPGEIQILLFAVLSVLAVLAARVWMPRFGDGGKVGKSLNDPLTRLVGRTGPVDNISGRQGKIEIDGVKWQARWEDGTIRAGAYAEVIGRDGSTVIVRSPPET